MRLDVLFENAIFYTQDRDRPVARRIGVLGGRIVGLDDDLDGVETLQTVDLNAGFVLPGLHDAHFHLTHMGRRARMIDVSPRAAPTLDTLYERIRVAANAAAPGAWIVAGAYDQNKLGEHPSSVGLDRVAPRNPVWVDHCSGHMGVANTRVFDLLGYAQGYGVPDVEHGAVGREPDGRASGLLQGNAQMYVPQAVGRPEQASRALDIREGVRAAAALGLTSVTEPGVGGANNILGIGTADLAAFQDLEERGELDVRCSLMPAFESLMPIEDVDQIGLPHGIRSGFGNDRLRLGATKAYADGSLIGLTAALRDPYANDPCNHGVIAFEPEEFLERFVRVHAAGWQIAVHAIGDHGIDLVLDAIETAQLRQPRPNARHRIEHYMVATDDQVARTARLGVVPVPQGSFIREFGDGYFSALGDDRARTCIRARSLLAAGIEIPGSSDAPVAPGDPLVSMQALVDRRTQSDRVLAGDEALDIAQAIRSYTIGSAYADHREHELGRLSPGYLADMTVLSTSPFEHADSFSTVKVRATVVGGEVVHDAW